MTGGNVALVMTAVRGHHEVVLKLNPGQNPDAAELQAEGGALSAWAGSSAAVQLLGCRDDGMTLLLERIQPGHTLDAERLVWDEKLELIGGLVRKLHAAGAALIHGDLHPGNVLRGPGRWVAIDPKGLRADRHADIWALICPQAPQLGSDPEAGARVLRGRVDRYAAAAGLDPERAVEWVRRRAEVECAEWLDLEAVHRLVDKRM
jgi:streptomycin 6-kinase